MEIDRQQISMLRRMRRYQGYSLRGLARKTSFSHQTIWKIERGLREVTSAEAAMFAEILNCPAGVLFSEDYLKMAR